MRFIDQVTITVRSGRGGAGAVSFKREKFLPHGGPDGGNGGKGGDVIVATDPRLGTLYDFTHRRLFKAANGGSGAGRKKTGRAGADLVITVPLGTLIYDDETGALLADLVEADQSLAAVRGGAGGKGNKHFATSTNRAPRIAQPGGEAEEKRLRLDLKLLADVALVGLPNAGKSTLISRLSAARPKVADYPFTTHNANLGVVVVGEFEPFVVADVPGLIPGASQGAGLGLRFLRHVERTGMLVFLLDAASDPEADLAVLKKELAAYSPRLAERTRLVALNKIDLLGDQAPPQKINGEPVHPISALTGQGVEALASLLAEKVENMASPAPQP